MGQYERKVHSALKSADYEAFCEARKSLNVGTGTAPGKDKQKFMSDRKITYGIQRECVKL